ncbi:MAG TPA: hypothetical protein VFH31_15465 [Pyrinomonadaceae bacterium]|nr:hypothetical protein [Pyrinomonadaceae bacterium]
MAIAVFVFLAYMAIVLNWILDGLFEELEWIQAENANFREYINKVIERAGEWMSNRAP